MQTHILAPRPTVTASASEPGPKPAARDELPVQQRTPPVREKEGVESPWTVFSSIGSVRAYWRQSGGAKEGVDRVQEGRGSRVQLPLHCVSACQ